MMFCILLSGQWRRCCNCFDWRKLFEMRDQLVKERYVYMQCAKFYNCFLDSWSTVIASQLLFKLYNFFKDSTAAPFLRRNFSLQLPLHFVQKASRRNQVSSTKECSLDRTGSCLLGLEVLESCPDMEENQNIWLNSYCWTMVGKKNYSKLGSSWWNLWAAGVWGMISFSSFRYLLVGLVRFFSYLWDRWEVKKCIFSFCSSILHRCDSVSMHACKIIKCKRLLSYMAPYLANPFFILKVMDITSTCFCC